MASEVDKHVLEESLHVFSITEKSEMLIKPEENVAEPTRAIKSLNNTLPVNNLIMKIDWSKSTLEKLPECESKFYYCTSLNLSCNQLDGCLDWIIHLKRLESLDVSFNKLTEIADVCGSSGTLKYLNFSNNLLKELPEWIALLSNIQNLNLSCNPLSKTSTNDLRMAKWKKIEICNLSHMNLSSIPECLLQPANNTYLKELYLGNPDKPLSSIEENVFWKVPECPSSLVVLDLSYVKLSGLSECNWGNLSNLKQLVAKGNDLFWPPDDFTLLHSLEICDLSSSKIIMLPKSFGNLSNLVQLNLAYNKLAVVPISFKLLENLQVLDLYMNEIDVVEPDLTLLPKLNKFDFWMNFCSPFECMPKAKYEDLCSKLRLDLGVIDTRLSNEAQPLLEESSFNPNYEKNLHFESSDDENGWTPNDEQEEIEKIESSTLSAGTGVEETWDDEVLFSDADSPEAAKIHVGTNFVLKKGVQIDDDHYFLPSKLHPKTSCCTAPSQFRIIRGQFDDAE